MPLVEALRRVMGEDAKKLKRLDKQNLQLKKPLAGAKLEKAALRELARGNL